MKTIVSIIVIVGLLLSFSSCIKIKSPYIQPAYYRLIQQPLKTGDITTLSTNKNIFIKEFDVSSDLETSKIAIIEDDKLVKYYNYHH